LNGLYICDGEIFQDGVSDRKILRVDGQHMQGKINGDVTGIHLLNQHDRLGGYFPRNMDPFFPRLASIRIVNSLDEITRDDLKGFPELVEFDISHSAIREIPHGLFEKNPKLRFISFWDNRNLHHVAHHVFDHLNLVNLHMYETSCISGKAVTTAAIEQLIFDVSRACPPTTRMLVEEILEEGYLTADFEGLEKRLIAIETRAAETDMRFKSIQEGNYAVVDEINKLKKQLYYQYYK
jgi:hypothetical protein